MADETRTRTGLPKGLIAGLTFVAGIVALLLMFRGGEEDITLVTPDFDVQAFEERVEEELEEVTLRPANAYRVRLGSVVWRDAAGSPFLQVPSATFTIDLDAGVSGGIRISSGVISNPEVRLVRYEDGRWNYERPLSPFFEGETGRRQGGGSDLGIVLAQIAIRNGLVTVDLPDTRFAARELDALLSSARLSGAGVANPTFNVATAEALLDLPDTAQGVVTRRVALDRAEIQLLDGAVAFDIDSGAFGTSTFADAQGVWSPDLGGLGLDAELRAEDFRIADIPWLRTEVPAEAAGSFNVRIEPAAGGQTAVALTGLSLTAPGSSATGSLRVLFGDAGFALESIDMRVDPLALSLVEAFTGPLPYTGTLRGTIQGAGGDIGFDLAANLATSLTGESFDTQLTGAVSFTPTGLALDRVTATLDRVPLSALDAIAPGLPFGGPVSGTFTLNGMPSEEPVQLEVRLEAGGGIVTVAGTVDLTGAVPAYDVQGRLVGVELRRVFEPAMPPAQLHATFAVAGSGTELAGIRAGVRLNGTFTGWRSEPGDTVALVGTLAGGRLDLDAGLLELGPVSATASGEWDLVGDGGGAITYALEVESLEPLAPYLPPDQAGRARFAHGALSAEGSISGTLAEPALVGTVDARDFRFGEWAAERLEGAYAARLGEAGLPAIEAEVTGTQIRTPSGDFESFDLNVDFTRPTFEIAVAADQLNGGVLQLEAAGRIEDAGGREIRLRTFEVDLEDERWRLPSPALIAWTTGEAVRVEGLRLEQSDGEGLLMLDGIVAPFDQADFALDVRSMPVGDLLDLAGVDFPLDGDLSMEGTVRGPSESPELILNLSLAEGTIRDVDVRGIRALLEYRDSELTIDGEGTLGDSALVSLSGQLPTRMTLGLPPTFELIEGREIAARLVTEDFPLATLDPGIRSVQELEGLLRADITVGGTPAEPRLTGEASLVDGAVTVPLLEKRYTDIRGSATLTGRELRITEIVARAGGTATVDGVITFDELTNPDLDLRATLDGFQPQGSDNSDDAAATGTVRLSGTVADPVVSGRVLMDEGTLSLVPFMGGPTLSENVVGIAESFAPIATGELDIPGAGTDPVVRLQNFELVAGDELWFATKEARAQLSGTLDLETIGNDHTVRGTLSGEQGTFDLRVGPVTRRFNVVDANIRFLGSPDPDPALDITASRRVFTTGGGSVDVRVRVTGNLSNPRLGLSSADGIAVGESELLSLVLFGQQTFSTGDVPVGAQQGVLSDLSGLAAIAGLSDYLSAELGEWDLVEELDQFQVQTRSGDAFDVGSLWIVAGKQFGDVLATLETPLGAPAQGGDLWVFSLEYRWSPQWTLEASFEPERFLGAPGAGGVPLPTADQDIDRQILVVVRRRWTY